MLLHPSGGISVREAGVIEESGGVDVMEEEGDEDEDDHDEDDHDDDDDEGGSDMDEDGADMIGDDSFRIYEEDAIYLPFDEGSGKYSATFRSWCGRMSQNSALNSGLSSLLLSARLGYGLHSLPPSNQVYKCIPANVMLRGTL